MSDLLSDKKIKQLCVKYLAWDEPVSNRDLELIKPLFKTQNAKTKKGILESLLSDIAVELDADQSLGEFYNNIHHKYHKWQALKKEVEDE